MSTRVKYNKNEYTITSNNIRFKRDPTLENFLRIMDVVTPEMMRGCGNPDGIGKGELMFTDITCIAMTLKGYKPMSIISKKEYYPFMNTLGAKIILHKHQYVLWMNDDYDTRAIEFVNYLDNKDQTDKHYYIMGNFLGYPTKDTDYFVEHLKQNVPNI
jgi:hypothetical protein